jgi:predicted HTH transcriptional regulator
MDLKGLLNKPENEKLEFKRDLSGKNTFIKDVCAFANSKGGIIVIGVDDTSREVVDIDQENLFRLEEKIVNMITDNIEPMVNFIVNPYNLDGRMILYVEIYPGLLTPYRLKSKGINEGVYVRIGSTSRPASQEYITELERRRLNISFDVTDIPATSKSDLDYSLIEFYLETRYQKNDIPKVAISEQFLESIKVLKRQGNHLVLSVAGVLLFGYSPSRIFPQSAIKCARFKDDDSFEYLDKKEFEGSLFKQLDNALNFFKVNEPKSAKIKGIYREESYAVPEIAIREALVNAIVHRDYNISGSDIKFNIYDSYIEIISPGRLPFGINIEDLGCGISKSRNPIMVSIFREMGIIEEYGKGIEKIKRAIDKHNLVMPKFEEVSDFFKVTFYKKKLLKRPSVSLIDDYDYLFMDYTKEQINEIKNYTLEKGYITNSKCRELLHISIDQAKYLLKRLVEENILEAIGKGKGRKYILKNPKGWN